jgi:hypothetical protein
MVKLMSKEKKLPPLEASRATPPEGAAAKKLAREQKDALVRGVTSIEAMRQAIRRAGRSLPEIIAVPRLGLLDAAAFRARAAQGLPFLITGLVGKWPLTALPPQMLRERYSHLPVRARVGDYINTAFAADRAMQDMSMLAYRTWWKPARTHCRPIWATWSCAS